MLRHRHAYHWFTNFLGSSGQQRFSSATIVQRRMMAIANKAGMLLRQRVGADSALDLNGIASKNHTVPELCSTIFPLDPAFTAAEHISKQKKALASSALMLPFQKTDNLTSFCAPKHCGGEKTRRLHHCALPLAGIFSGTYRFLRPQKAFAHQTKQIGD